MYSVSNQYTYEVDSNLWNPNKTYWKAACSSQLVFLKEQNILAVKEINQRKIDLNK